MVEAYEWLLFTNKIIFGMLGPCHSEWIIMVQCVHDVVHKPLVDDREPASLPTKMGVGLTSWSVIALHHQVMVVRILIPIRISP